MNIVNKNIQFHSYSTVYVLIVLIIINCTFVEPARKPTPTTSTVVDDGQITKRCSTVLIGKIDKVSTEYIWEIKGFLEHLDYLKDFDPTFELNSEKVNFTTSPELGGIWNFRIFKETPITQQSTPKEGRKATPTPLSATSNNNGSTTGSTSPTSVSGSSEANTELSIQAIHNWHEIITESNPPEKRGINYKAILEIVYKNVTIWKETKTTIADIQFKFISTGRYKHQYIYTFKWRQLQVILGNLIKINQASSTTPNPNSDGNGSDDEEEDESDIRFHFTMIAHLPSETKIVSTDCDDLL